MASAAGCAGGLLEQAGFGDVIAVQQAGLGLEASAIPVGYERDADGEHHDSRGAESGELEVEAFGAHQQHGAVHGVDGIVPDQGGQDSEAQHDDAERHAADADFQAADKEGLLRIAGVAEAPDEAGQHHGDCHVARELAQKGDGEHAEEKLLGDGGQEAAEEDEGPGKPGIEQIGIRYVGRRPGAALVGEDVEPGLVGDEDAGERDAEDAAEKEMPRAQSAQGEEITQRDLIAERFAIERFGAGGEDEEEAARAERGEQRVEELAREEAAVGIRGGIAELVEREFIQLRQEAEHDGDEADQGGAPPGHVVTAHAHHDDNQHADDRASGSGRYRWWRRLRSWNAGAGNRGSTVRGS